MKTFLSLCGWFGVACLLSNGCSAQDKKDTIAPPAANAPAVTADTTVAAEAATAAAAVTASDSWDLVKDYTYDQRGAFAAGLAHMTERMDAAIARLNAQRARRCRRLPIKDLWDFAMKELLRRAFRPCASKSASSTRPRPETWNDVKDKLCASLAAHEGRL